MADAARLESQVADRPSKGRIREALFGSKLGLLGTALLVFALGLAFLGPMVSPYDPTDIVSVPGLSPSDEFLLGTDALGRDVLSRVLNGGVGVVILPFVGMLLAFGTLGVIGMIAGYKGGRFDGSTSFALNILLGIPPYLGALVIFAGLGESPTLVIAILVFMFGPRVARVLRGAVALVRHREFVLAAEARGEHTMAIVIREIAPNVAPIILAEFALRMTYSIVFVASLNFLGLGVNPPTPAWGLMAAENRIVISINPAAVLAPSMAIATLALGVNFLADSIAASVAGRSRNLK
jgi:peptide/nickel transport system permease protein